MKKRDKKGFHKEIVEIYCADLECFNDSDSRKKYIAEEIFESCIKTGCGIYEIENPLKPMNFVNTEFEDNYDLIKYLLEIVKQYNKKQDKKFKVSIKKKMRFSVHPNFDILKVFVIVKSLKIKGE